MFSEEFRYRAVIWMAGGDLVSSTKRLQSGPFISTAQDISALVGCIKKLMALYEVQLCETFQIQQLDLH